MTLCVAKSRSLREMPGFGGVASEQWRCQKAQAGVFDRAEFMFGGSIDQSARRIEEGCDAQTYKEGRDRYSKCME
jgi:hypothetical protein